MKYLSNSRLPVAATLFILIVTAAVAAWAANRRDDADRVRVENKTRALVVESVKDLGEIQAGGQRELSRLEVTVRNRHDKPIAAYRFRVDDSLTGKGTISGVERSGALDGWSLPPDGVDVTRLTVPPDGEVLLTVAAVLFEDGTGEGDTKDLLRLQEVHAGIRAALQKIVPILRQEASTDEPVELDAAIRSLENEVASINDREVPVNQRRGFAEAKDYILLELSDLKNDLSSKPDLKYKAEVKKKLEKIEKALAKM